MAERTSPLIIRASTGGVLRESIGNWEGAVLRPGSKLLPSESPRTSIAWMGHDRDGREISAKLFAMEAGRLNGVTITDITIKRESEAFSETFTLSRAKRDLALPNIGLIYIGEFANISNWTYSICRALEDGISPRQIKLAVTDAYYGPRLEELRRKVLKDKPEGRKYSGELYEAFCAELALARYIAH